MCKKKKKKKAVQLLYLSNPKACISNGGIQTSGVSILLVSCKTFFFFFCMLQPRKRALVLETIASFITVQGNSEEFGNHFDSQVKVCINWSTCCILLWKVNKRKWLSSPPLFGGCCCFIQSPKAGSRKMATARAPDSCQAEITTAGSQEAPWESVHRVELNEKVWTR